MPAHIYNLSVPCKHTDRASSEWAVLQNQPFLIWLGMPTGRLWTVWWLTDWPTFIHDTIFCGVHGSLSIHKCKFEIYISVYLSFITLQPLSNQSLKEVNSVEFQFILILLCVFKFKLQFCIQFATSIRIQELNWNIKGILHSTDDTWHCCLSGLLMARIRAFLSFFLSFWFSVLSWLCCRRPVQTLTVFWFMLSLSLQATGHLEGKYKHLTYKGHRTADDTVTELPSIHSGASDHGSKDHCGLKVNICVCFLKHVRTSTRISRHLKSGSVQTGHYFSSDWMSVRDRFHNEFDVFANYLRILKKIYGFPHKY